MNDRNGQVPTPEEFFDHCIAIADTCEQSLVDAHALRDEARRALLQVNNAYAASQRDVRELGERWQAKYSPEVVEQAGAKAKGQADAFSTAVDTLKGRMETAFGEALARSIWRVWVPLAIVVLFALVVGGLAYWKIPGLDEIKARRAEVAALEQRAQIATAKLSLGDKLRTCPNGRLCVYTDESERAYQDAQGRTARVIAR